ncbi:MAG TPA: O-antigen ligase family protein, partial [Gemmatimonadaceae bacterium]
MPHPQLQRRTLSRPVRAVAAKLAPLRVSLSGIRLPLFLLIIITISRVHQNFPILAKVRPALLLFAWALAMLVFGDKRSLALGNVRELPSRLILWLGAAAMLSVPFGISIGGSASYFLNAYSKTLILALMVAVAIRNADDLWTMVWAYVIAVGILALMTMTVFRMGPASASGFSRLGDGYTYDANDIGLVCVTGLPLCLATFRTSRTFGKAASLMILAMSCVAIARTGSRGAFLGILSIAAGLLLMARGTGVGKRLVIAVIGAGALAIAAPQGYLSQMSTITNPTDDYNWTSQTGRKEVAKRGFGYLMRNPVTGIGLWNFPRAEGTLSEAAQAFEEGGAGVKWSTTHNSYLQALVEMGIIGGVLFAALIIVGIGFGRTVRRMTGARPTLHGSGQLLVTNVAEYLPIAFIGFAVTCFFLSFAY